MDHLLRVQLHSLLRKKPLPTVGKSVWAHQRVTIGFTPSEPNSRHRVDRMDYDITEQFEAQQCALGFIMRTDLNICLVNKT